jgi:hypothetical protein
MHGHIRETMFMNNYDETILSEMHKCVRVMPHHQNTSGFFITVIEKIADLSSPVIAETEIAEVFDPIV